MITISIKNMQSMRSLLVIIAIHCSLFTSVAQSSDSLIYRQLTDYGIRFTDDNSVTLLSLAGMSFAPLSCSR